MKTETINIITIKQYSDSLLLENPVFYSKLKKINIDGVVPDELFLEVLKFMYLVSIIKVKLTPSIIVDYGWHEFILFTKLYDQFCIEKFGRFIHHTPDDGKTTNNRNYIITIQHYIKVFGKPPLKFWGEISIKEWEDSQCGSCQSN